ncbi:response regulator transcription factor [Paenibacillus sp. HN-1]|uniref:response regulator transcription factor n=1 Tax=Paenibacillus TaxID=44249 RepID=UPI001CA8E251|nr:MULTISPECIES: response regulator transcription factor [Paenibacillus]MBY9078339.1 response regulator transcription factor [Paenibacillus sp. CGMCC 1.18879]MBY9083151.1 response regulator transcription factor [Paenibacillus sinensis]
MFKVLIAEDDKNTAKWMKAVISDAGYEVLLAEDGNAALEIMDLQHVDLIIVDIMMPVLDGLELTRMIRESRNNIPILMVTAKQLSIDKQKGFLAGTDDYLVKPVDEDEMLLRIRALLRRAQVLTERKLHLGKVTLDYDAFTISRANIILTLPQKEFYLLYKLLSFPNKIFTRIQLMDEIWGKDSETTDVTVNVHINRLRKRFKNDFPEFEIVAIRGIGYKAVIHHDL